VRVEIDDKNMRYMPEGQPIEVGLVKFLFDNDLDVPQMLINRNLRTPKVHQLPFSQFHKRKVVIRKVDSVEDIVRVYIKGAPEYVIPFCNKTLDYTAEVKDFDDNDVASILNEVVRNEMACQGLKPLSYAFKEMHVTELEEFMQTYSTESEEFRDEIEKDMIYLCTFGL